MISVIQESTHSRDRTSKANVYTGDLKVLEIFTVTVLSAKQSIAFLLVEGWVVASAIPNAAPVIPVPFSRVVIKMPFW